jgi:small subunit ribosomal protein S36
MQMKNPNPRPDLSDAGRLDGEAPRVPVPGLVWWISALHVTVLLAYTVLLPTYRAPDEMLHVDLAHVFSEDFHYPAWDERDTGSGILRSLGIVHFHTRSAHLEASAAPHKEDRPSLDELDEPPRARSINQLSQHPPLYYAVAGTLERGVELMTGDPIGAFDVEAWFYRLVSVAMVAPLPLIAWALGRRLGVPRPVGIAATLVPLAIPQYLHMGAVANNDSLMILLFWLLTLVVLRLADGDLRVRTAALAGLLTGLALYTKGFALVLPAWVFAALLVALTRLGRQHLRGVVTSGLVYTATTLACGGWWWIANLVRYNELLPTRFSEMVAPIESDVRNYGEFLEIWGSITTRRFWGDFGWFDVHIPSTAVIAATAVVVVGLVVACTRRDRVAGSRISDRLLLAVPIVLLVAMQFATALRAYIHLGRMPGLQGRYWFGALAALAVIVTLGLANLARRRIRWLPLGVFGAAVAMNAVAVSTILGFYWGVPDSAITSRVRAVVAWAPMPGEVLAAGGVVGGLIAVITTVQLVAATARPCHGRRGEPSSGVPPPSPVERLPAYSAIP